MMPTLKRSACTHVAYASAVWLALLCIAPAPWASASEDPPEANVEGEWRCAPQTGVWTALPDGGWSIAAALCTPPAEACADFTALSFDAQGKLLELRVAGTPSAYDVCSMKALARLPSFGLFQRGDELFGVDNGSLKIVWHYVFAPVDNVQTHGSHQLALLSSNSFLLLTEKDGAIQVQRVDELNGLQELRWMGETRLVAVTADAFEWWELAAGGKLGPRSRSLAPAPPKAGDYVIDPIGVMLSPRGSTMVASMRFDSGEWVRISLNATESSRGAAGEPGISVAVASDGAVTNLVARMGTVLRKRFEHRYWKLSEKDLLDEEGAQRQLVTGIGSTLILDGGVSEPKALLIDASEMTWKMRSILRYEAPGRFLNITERQLWTFHPSGAHPFIAWELATGASAQRIPVSQLEEAGMSRPVHASILSREGWLWSSDENAGIALLDLPNATLSKPLLANQGEHFSLDAELGTGVIFARQRGEEVLAWDFLGFDGGHSALRPSGEAKDALDMSERWFPYCATDTLCPKTQLSFEPRPETPQTAQDWALVPPIERGTHWALLIAIGAILIALATLIWRRRVGQKGQLEHELPIAPDGAAEGPSLMARLALLKVTALVDPRGRRFLTAKDYDGFVRKGALGAILRLGLGLGLGLAIAAGLSYAKLLDQAPSVIIAYALALSLPLGLAIWISLSWSTWNRLSLLLYGRAVEAQWFDAGSKKLSLCYTLADGRTFRMRRGQWDKADLVPVVLYDPKRPRFAIQYTGNGSFAVDNKREDGRLVGGARTFDALSFGLVLCVLLGLGAAGYLSFDQHFPESLSAWELDQLETRSQEQDQGFIVGCLQRCDALSAGQQEDCHQRCERRQLRLILKAAGVSLERDPESNSAELARAQLEQVESVLTMLQAQPEQRCSELAQRIDQVSVWSPALYTAFAQVYGEDTHGNDALAAARSSLIQARDTVFSALCEPQHACFTCHEQSCRQTCAALLPRCQGQIDTLQRSLCSFSVAVFAPFTAVR